MPDDKRGREKQARDADQRQRERDVLAQLERSEETEPPVDERVVDDIDELEQLEFPATGADIVAAVGERVIESDDGTMPIRDLVPETDTEVFDTPEDVRLRIRRPTVARAMKRIVEANEAVSNDRLGASKRTAYEKTLRALKGIDADDNDEGVTYITDWIVDRTHEKEATPNSRDVRREAAEFCRENGYQVSNNDWLGI